MPEQITMRCQACGQGWQLVQTDVYNTLPPTHCPQCGTPTLVRDSQALGGGAACFANVSKQLVELLYREWRLPVIAERTTRAGAANRHSRFIDYLRAALSGQEPE